MHLRLRGKILLIFVSLFFVSCSIIAAILNLKISSMAEENVLKKLNGDSKLGYELFDQMYAGSWSIKDGKLLKGEHVLNDDFTAVDKIKESTGSLATIFLGDTRISTNVLKEDGSRAVGTKVSEKVAQTVLKEGREFVGEIDVVGKLHLARYIPIKDSAGNAIGIWFVGVNKDDAMKIVYKTAYQTTFINIGITLLGVLVILLFTNKIITNAKNILSVLDAVSMGNLTVKSSVKTKDEIGLISKGINGMIEQIGRLVKEVKEMSFHVKSTSEDTAASAKEVSIVSEQVATTIYELAKGATEQASSIENGSSKLKHIIKGLEQIAKDMENSKELTNHAVAVIMDGEKSVRYQEEKMNENKQVSVNVTLAILDLSSKSQEIGQILEVIRGIAEQTNLLALNAAIEAARAGENGKGFAVVAEEVRGLAEQSSASVKKITEIIKEVLSGVEKAVYEMGKAETVVNEQSKAMSQTSVSFDKISGMVSSISNKLKSVSDASNTLYFNAQHVGESVHDIAIIAEETASGTEEVSASTEEQCSIINQISDSAGKLSKLASELNSSISKFTTD